MNEAIEISKLIDRYLPAEGVGTERERIRMEMHNDIAMLKRTEMNNENWIESSNPPKPNTQCKVKTPAGTDEVGQAWFDGNKWWHWGQGIKVKFGLKDGWVTHYIPLFVRTE